MDDYEYNQGLKDVQRWNDPAAGFLTVILAFFTVEYDVNMFNY